MAYRLLDAAANGNVGAALANKATRMQLKDKAAKVEATEAQGTDQEIEPYDGGEIVYMFVR